MKIFTTKKYNIKAAVRYFPDLLLIGQKCLSRRDLVVLLFKQLEHSLNDLINSFFFFLFLAAVELYDLRATNEYAFIYKKNIYSMPSKKKIIMKMT